MTGRIGPDLPGDPAQEQEVTEVIEFVAVMSLVVAGLAVMVAGVVKVVSGLPAGRGKDAVRD